jgi:hypothetical protein
MIGPAKQIKTTHPWSSGIKTFRQIQQAHQLTNMSNIIQTGPKKLTSHVGGAAHFLGETPAKYFS